MFHPKRNRTVASAPSPRTQIERLLLSPPPVRYRVAHGLDPRSSEHMDAYDALAGRAALALLEAQATGAGESDAWLAGAEAGLSFWARTARQRPAWSRSLSLEARDVLWLQGHPILPPDADDDVAGRFLALCGVSQPVQLREGQSVRIMRHPLRPSPATAPSADSLAAALRAVAQAEPADYRVVQGRGAMVDVQATNRAGRLRAVSRSSIWPLGDPEVRRRRSAQVRFVEDSLVAAASWSGAPFNEEEFFVAATARLLADPLVWAGAPLDGCAPIGSATP
jgi:hypothetical protein